MCVCSRNTRLGGLGEGARSWTFAVRKPVFLSWLPHSTPPPLFDCMTEIRENKNKYTSHLPECIFHVPASLAIVFSVSCWLCCHLPCGVGFPLSLERREKCREEWPSVAVRHCEHLSKDSLVAGERKPVPNWLKSERLNSGIWKSEVQPVPGELASN